MSISSSIPPLLRQRALFAVCLDWSGMVSIILFALLAMSTLVSPSSSGMPGFGASMSI